MKKYIASLIAPFVTILAMISLALPMALPVAVQAQTATGSGFCYTFNNNLGEGRFLSSADANALQQVLTTQGFWTSGTPITTYNDAVASAVSGFQEKYATQILTPNSLSYGTGYVGASTRAELNSLYGCRATATSNQPFQCPVGYTCTPISQTPVFTCPSGWTCTSTTNSNPLPTNNGSVSVSYISPTFGLPGINVTLAGTGFGAASLVSITGSGYKNSVRPNAVSSNTLTFTMPSDVTSGTYNIQVIGSMTQTYGTMPTSNYVSFVVTSTSPTYIPLTITSITPSSGPVGTLITLTGTGFGAASIVDVSASGFKNSYSPSTVSPSSLTFTAGTDMAPGTYSIRVVGSAVQTFGTMPTSNYTSFTLSALSSTNYKPISLKDVINYASTSVNNYVSTSGVIVKIDAEATNDSILLTDNSGNYLLVTVADAFVGNYSKIISQLNVGDTILVKGTASYTTDFMIAGTDYNNLGTIGLISLDPQNGIQVSVHG